MKFFNYQILHRTLLTNNKLHQFNRIDLEKCDTCEEVETMSYLLVDCPGNKKLWDDMIQYIHIHLNENNLLDKKNTLFLETKTTRLFLTS